MRKKFLSEMLSAAMVTTLVSGCSGSTENETTTPAPSQSNAETTTAAETTKADNTETTKGTDTAEKVTLKWAIWDKESTAYWQALADAYEASHDNVTIDMVDLGSTDYMTVLATELSGSGTEFDVVTVKDVPGYATLVQKNAIRSLDDYIKADGVDLSKYAGVTDQVTVDGSLYELPFRNDFWVLFYNKDILDAEGVEYPTNDMTFEEYDALARKVTKTDFGNHIY